MTIEEAFRMLAEKGWQAESSLKGLWAVGVSVEGMGLNVLGMAPSLPEAVEMALRSVPEVGVQN